jgi:hypothetical protein
MLLTADQTRSPPEYFGEVADPRRGQGRRHPLPAAMAMAVGAMLCGARGYKANTDDSVAAAIAKLARACAGSSTISSCRD